MAGVAQLVEQLTCNQPVGGSTPLASSIFFVLLRRAQNFCTGPLNFYVLGRRISIFVCRLKLRDLNTALNSRLMPLKISRQNKNFLALQVNLKVDKSSSLLDNTSPFGGVPERSKGSDCKSDAKASVVRIHLPPPAS